MNTLELPNKKHYWSIFFLLLILAFFYNLGIINLQFEEPRRAVVALEMDLTGQYIVPKINGFDYYNKPPIYNWLLILLTKIFGSFENWIYRIPTVASLISISWVSYRVTRKKVGEKIAIFSALFILTSANILFYFSFMGEIDMFYSLIVYLQILTLLHFFQKRSYAQLFLISYLLTAIGVLTKGLPSFAFQSVTILSLFLYHRRFKELFSIWNFLGIILMAFLLGGYFILYNEQSDVVPYLTRLISESSRRTIAAGNWTKSIEHLYKFPLLLFSMMAPWLLMIPLKQFKSIWKKVVNHEWLRLILVFLIPNLIVYWISPGTLDRYLYMFLPFILVIVTFMFSLSKQKFFPWIAIIIYTVAIILPFLIPSYAHELPKNQGVAVSIIVFIIAALSIFFYFKLPRYRVFLLICFLLAARLSYNFLTLPIRSLHRPPFPQLVERLIDHKVDGIQSEETKEFVYNPLLRKDILIKKLNHPPYQLSFYYAKETRSILKYYKEEETGKTYLKKIDIYKKSSNHIPLDTLNIKEGNGKGNYLIYQVKTR